MRYKIIQGLLVAAFAFSFGAIVGRDYLQPRAIEHTHDAEGNHGGLMESEPRSACWKHARAEYIAKHPTCEACGRDKSHNLNVHHCIPFSRDKSLECAQSNLITMCRDCHELLGHLRHFDSYNPDVRKDSADMLKKIENRP